MPVPVNSLALHPINLFVPQLASALSAGVEGRVVIAVPYFTSPVGEPLAAPVPTFHVTVIGSWNLALMVTSPVGVPVIVFVETVTPPAVTFHELNL